MGAIEHQTLSDRLCDGGGDFTRYDFTYVSATTMTIPGDWTGIFKKGTKLEITQSETRYGYIFGSSYSAPDTTLTVSPMNDAAGNIHTLDNAAISNVYAGNICTLREHPEWINFNPNMGSYGDTVPTYTSIYLSKFRCSGNALRWLINWVNTSGGTAGSGGAGIYFYLPIKPINSDMDFAGFHHYYEASGEYGVGWVILGNTSVNGLALFRNFANTGILTGDSQSSTERHIRGNGIYQF